MTRPHRCAYLTMNSLEGFFCSDSLTYKPLERLGWTVDEVSWRSTSVSWGDFDLVVIRSPWDYSDAPAAFLTVLEQIDASDALLANPLSVVRWNLDKSYLRELRRKGISIVPTQWCDRLSGDDLQAAFSAFTTDEIVVKPTIGAGARDTYRLRNNSSDSAFSSVLETFRNRPAMLQPFLVSIVERGEFSLFYFAGELSHCISKLPAPGDFRVQEEHGGIITLCTPTELMREEAHRVLKGIDEELLYARVDLVELASGELAVIEVELIEPSLYFGYDERAAGRFASALDRMYRKS